MESLEDKVIDFFKEWLPAKKEYNLNTIINTIDLDREDAIMIFEEFINEFKINSGYMNFDIDKYFYKISFLEALFFSAIKLHIIKKYKEKPPITFKHMIEVAERSEWFEPDRAHL